eukprot:CAMPEP_0198363082 /NCGR_PEP_ID=MMETSP1450-20131203/148512_1 /TAXON_ID=753684 ORGANISM="Madagascaria erythrocladiodes, Strain CCMP3234" /NCGR_SAMPLE_ID=MMETSP1450 /ASSEMBLY_ACC=CAM_ASM_001115 /LENGTH=36 /DNA_ID= /DNA_START= /DNA_END= /DNA_ORIENTATION=
MPLQASRVWGSRLDKTLGCLKKLDRAKLAAGVPASW